jgi:lysozyme family protein
LTDLTALKMENAARWRNMKLTRNFTTVAQHLIAAKSVYQSVSVQTGVPWWIIAVIHERESSQDWTRSLAQGDKWNAVSVHVPAGRGPFGSWGDAAVDALVNCPPRAAHWPDWSAGGALTLLEQYNGVGYFSRGAPSPYIWSGTDQYVSGKYVRDGVYDPNVVDSQLGCAGLLKAMMMIDPTIAFWSAGKPPPVVSKVPAPAPARSGWAAFIAALLAFFRRKRP